LVGFWVRFGGVRWWGLVGICEMAVWGVEASRAWHGVVWFQGFLFSSDQNSVLPLFINCFFHSDSKLGMQPRYSRLISL
jgi:hypothetical protein